MITYVSDNYHAYIHTRIHTHTYTHTHAHTYTHTYTHPIHMEMWTPTHGQLQEERVGGVLDSQGAAYGHEFGVP